MPSRYLPISLDVKDSDGLVVGGGQVALRKVEWLRSAGARVAVIAERACHELGELAASRAIALDERRFEDADLTRARYAVVIAATDDRALNARISELARARAIPVNVVDAPELCTFIVPARVDRAPVTIAISTEGASPVLARLVRRRIESILPLELGELARFAARHRDAVKRALPEPAARRALWERVLEGAAAERVLEGDERGADAALARELAMAQTGAAEPASAAPAPIDVVVLPSAGLDALTLRALRVLGRADTVLYERGARQAVRHFARRDAAQRELDLGAPSTLRDALASAPPAGRTCVVCEERSSAALFAEFARQGRAFSR